MHTAIVLSANGAYQHVNGVDTDQRELHLLGTSHVRIGGRRMSLDGVRVSASDAYYCDARLSEEEPQRLLQEAHARGI